VDIGRDAAFRGLHRDVAFRAGNDVDVPVGLVATVAAW
jgi:hypothetical protein